MCQNTQIIISVIEGHRQIQKIHTTGKNAVEEARKQLEEKYLQKRR
jgi:hypothetical protein